MFLVKMYLKLTIPIRKLEVVLHEMHFLKEKKNLSKHYDKILCIEIKTNICLPFSGLLYRSDFRDI